MLLDTLETLRQTQAQLVHAEKMAGLGQLTAGIAHEINNPITFILGMIAPLRQNIQEVIHKEVIHQEAIHNVHPLDKLPTTEQSLDTLVGEIDVFLGSIETGAVRIANLVQNLKTFARVDEYGFKLTDIHADLDATLQMLHYQYDGRITICKQYSTEVTPFFCIPGQMNQVFMHILTNALQAIPDTGSITIATALVQEQSSLCVHIVITDTGVGMSEENQRRAFEPFYSTKDVGKAKGLGLTIAFGIVEYHGGTIRIASTPQVGTTVTISVPFRKTSP
jgi:signal transduction histidine kinase